MPAQKKNPVLRAVVPVVLLAFAAIAVTAVFLNSSKTSAPPPATPQATAPGQAPVPTTAATTTAAPESASAVPQPSDAAATPEASSNPEMTAAPAGTAAPKVLRARSYDPAVTSPATLGSLDQASGYRAQIAFTPLGAGVDSITATDYFATLRDKQQHKRGQADAKHYEIQKRGRVAMPDGRFASVASLSALGVNINNRFVGLFSEVAGDVVRPVWREEAPGTFVAEIVDENDVVVAHITRSYEFDPGSFVFRVRQIFDNRTAEPMKVEWIQYGPVDLEEDKTGYSLDVRRLRYGYVLKPQYGQNKVEADDRLAGRGALVKKWFEKSGVVPGLWPDSSKYSRAESLSWVAQTSRYFAFVVMPLVNDPAAVGLNKTLPIAAQIDAVVLGQPDDARLALQLTSPVVGLAAGQSADLSFAAYAGPLGREQLNAKTNPMFGALGLDELVIYNLGGMCAFCTFQWIALPLVKFLTILHNYVVFDWAIAIMILVCCVRLILHPITKKSQVGMQRFARQMQRIAPKQKKLQEKFKGDPKQLQVEIAKLMREEKVSYRGALGCLPMFLQTPIWIAVYAVIYFTFALRHESAFYGVFQNLTGGKWTFLGDLAAPDHFIEFGRAFHIPLLSGLMGPISGINILPLILGVVFYIQQKYLTPPPSAPLTPEQETQQKMMKVMMVVMFPVFMYNAPSALALYFLTNSTLGILESRYIRSHIDQLELDKEIDAATGRKQVTNQARPATKKDRERKFFKDRP